MASLSYKMIVWFAIFVLEGVVILCCNVFGLIIFNKKALYSRPCLLLANQCLADCLVGITALYYSGIFYATQTGFLQYHKFDSTECLDAMYIVNLFLWTFSLGGSFISLALIALERVYAVFKPFKHRVLRKKSYLRAIFIIWIISIVQSTLSVFNNCYKNKIRDIFYVFPIIIFLSALFVIVVSYGGIHIKLKYFQVFQNNAHNRKEVRLCRTVFYATVASVVTLLPFFVVKFNARMKCFFMYEMDEECLPQYILGCSLFLFFANSFINFFIYVLRFPGFGQSAKRILFCKNKFDNRIQEGLGLS